MLPLLRSLNEQDLAERPVEILFADDCSTDNTAALIARELKIPYSLIRLDRKSGKKEALNQAITLATAEHVLTLDADVALPENYLIHLFQLPAADMVILPVKMTGKKWIQHLAAVEFDWLQLLAFGAVKPVLCNGANLVFSKKAYTQASKIRSDFDLASGDDVFLLSAFRHHKREILRVYDEVLTVQTPAPQSAAELFQQRRRWISKLARMNDSGSYLALLFLVVVETGFLFSLIALFFNPLYLILIALKLITEFMIAANAGSADLRTTFTTCCIHQVWYPLYLILLLFPQQHETRWEHEQSSGQQPYP